jgi:putative transposase
MKRSYTVQLRVTKRQEVTLSALLVHLCDLYNAALGERKSAWETCRKSIAYHDQQAELTQLRAIDPDSESFPVVIQRDPLRRVKLAFDGFFRRVGSGNPGYPRFRSVRRYDSFTVDHQNFSLISGSVVRIAKIGSFRFHTRCCIKGMPRSIHIKRLGQKWKAIIVCDIGSAPAKTSVDRAVGIDVGLTSLATLSDGREIENPRWTRQAQDELARASRQLASKVRGSNNRAKARERLRKVHQAIQGRRRAYLHAVSRWLLLNYDLIAFENLAIRNMTRGNLAKSIMDAAWGELIWQITYKAEEAGKWAVPVNPKNTTQACSGCETIVPKGLADRTHACPECGLVLGRDHNAAINVLQRGVRCVEASTGVQK